MKSEQRKMEVRVRSQVNFWFTGYRDGVEVHGPLVRGALAICALPLRERQGAILRLGDDIPIPLTREQEIRLKKVKRYLTQHLLKPEEAPQEQTCQPA